MTDIQRHLKAIRKVAHRHVTENAAITDDLLNAIVVELRQTLPKSYGVVRGILTDGVRQSASVQILLYDRPLSKNTYTDTNTVFHIDHTLLVLDLAVTHSVQSLCEMLNRVASVKALVQRTSSNGDENSLPPGQRREKIPTHRLPVAMVYCNALDDTSASPEAVVNALLPCLDAHPLRNQPDYLTFVEHNLLYRNALLFPNPPTGYEIGVSVTPKLKKPRDCYVCKQPYFHQHFFYVQLCSRCGDLNYRKRQQTADLRGRVAVVTGARVKIGYAVALRLLRAGATVIATSRFPHDTARRYAQEDDFSEWQDRLHVYGLDLRNLPAVEVFVQHLYHTYPHLDILVNNAAQTIKRPPAYYAHLLPLEQTPPAQLPAPLRPLLDNGADAAHLPVPYIAAQRDDLPQLPAGDTVNDADFPEGQFDVHGQQVDNRAFNSWVMQIQDVSMREMLEVHLANAIAPGILVGQLRDLMRQSPRPHRHIVNVSAVEGRFARRKVNGYHPHTNMAKAALNMLTHTVADDYANDGIYVNSVDPGYVSDQVPRTNAAERQAADATLPLDMQDAAARVCDPVFSVENGDTPTSGAFTKDYKSSAW